MGAHTPGPWLVSRGAQADAFAIEAASRTVAHVKTCREAEANARILAAAPEMLEALKGLLGDNNPPGGLPGHIDFAVAVAMARKAIVKAEGA